MIQYFLTKPKNKRKKILVFSCDIAHARYLTMWLKMIGITADYVDSGLYSSRNMAKIKKFREISNPNGQVLINTDMLTTGFDVPDVDCVIMGRPVMSTVEYTQMIGRGMRGSRMGGTEIVWIIDFDDQVQRKTHMSDQFISLGWKSMAYNSDGTNVWRKLEEHEEDENGKYLNLNEIIEITEKSENMDIGKDFGNTELQLTSDKSDLSSKSSNESIINVHKDKEKIDNVQNNYLRNPWIEYIESEKTNPIALEFIKFIVNNTQDRSAVDIETIIDLRKIVKRIIGYQTSMNNAQINLTYNSYDKITLNILETIFQKAKEDIQKFGLINFQTASIIMILKPIIEKEKIVKLCDSYIISLDIIKNISYRQELNKPKLSMKEQLENEFIKITYEHLGCIPTEEYFKSHISSDLWEFLENNFTTYYNWTRIIRMSEHIIRINQRSKYLDIAIDIINLKKVTPNRDILQSFIHDFDETITKNFFKIELFFVMIDNIFQSWKNASKNFSNFDKLVSDYECVKKLNEHETNTELFLRHSKVGIGSYIKYCGNLKNFICIYELDHKTMISDTNATARVNLEMLKSKFFEMKSVLNRIPNQKEMSTYSNYDNIIEYFWFNDYSDFLKFLGEDDSILKNPLNESISKSNKSNIIREDNAYIKKNGVHSLFDKIIFEGEFKYEMNFGSVLEFIKIILPQDTKMYINIWNDKKN